MGENEARHVAHVGENEVCVLVENPEGKRPLRGPRHRWEDTTGMNLGQM
jgi:hypothetical protein